MCAPRISIYNDETVDLYVWKESQKLEDVNSTCRCLHALLFLKVQRSLSWRLIGSDISLLRRNMCFSLLKWMIEDVV